jgi:hypothetical protein
MQYNIARRARGQKFAHYKKIFSAENISRSKGMAIGYVWEKRESEACCERGSNSTSHGDCPVSQLR